VGVAVSSADCVDRRVDLGAETGRLMRFCSGPLISFAT
jgi:hypothetical protein